MLGLVKLTRSLSLQPNISRTISNPNKVLSLCQVSSGFLGNFSVQGVPTLLEPGPLFQTVRHAHHCIRDLRTNFRWKRERPVGPHKHRPPNLVGSKNSLNYRHIIKYPEDGKYTIKKLDVQKLGGRHPLTGRKVIEGVGGGSKQKARWIDLHRLPADWPKDGAVLEERVIMLKYDPMRKAQIMMTGYGNNLRWQIATDKVKPGDIIKTDATIPVNPIRAREGDSHPLGALPLGSTVCLVEAWPGEGSHFAVNAEENCKILRKVDDRVVVKCWDWYEFAIPQEAMCTVGTVSIHPLKALPISSPNRMRWLGIRMRSGLWKRKDGRKGRKIKKPPPTIYTVPKAVYYEGMGTPSNPGIKGRTILLDNLSEGKRGRIKPNKRCHPDAPRNSLAYKKESRPGFDGKNPGVPGYKYGVVQGPQWTQHGWP